jgi:hypothetical protein
MLKLNITSLKLVRRENEIRGNLWYFVTKDVEGIHHLLHGIF